MKLEINNLNKTYPNGVQALKNFSLEIGKGMFGLLGQNGAGKSSLMRTIATLQEVDSGSIHFDNIDIINQPRALRKILGYLPQEFGVYPNVSAYELLMHIADLKGISSKGARKDQVESLLHKVNLQDFRNNKLEGFSGGMKQRFGIAQALLANPKLIIVDEPTAGLDPMERNRFYNLLSELGEESVVILSTHIVEDVNTLCSEMAVIGKGEVLLKGKPNEIESALDGQLWEKVIDKSELEKYSKEFRLISNRFYMSKMIITVVSDQSPGLEFSAKEPSLEDAYFNLLYNQKNGLLV